MSRRCRTSVTPLGPPPPFLGFAPSSPRSPAPCIDSWPPLASHRPWRLKPSLGIRTLLLSLTSSRRLQKPSPTQPPPTTVPPVRPPGPQADAQWAPPGDKTVQNLGGAETSETRRGGGGGGVGESFRSLREEDKLGTRVQIPREGANRHGR